MPDRKSVVAVLAVPESTASTLYGMQEILESAGRDWSALTTGEAGEQVFRPVIVSATGETFRAVNGLSVTPHAALAAYPTPDIITIPDLMIMPGEDIAGRYDREIAWIRAAYAAGATLATACTGAMVLAEAGLLDGRDVTTHWAYCEAMQSRYPRTRVHPNRALVTAGDGQRLIMAGGGTSWHDLALFLIARFAGIEEAIHVARLQLIDWHHIGQQPFATLTSVRQVDDAVIASCQAWIAEHYDTGSPVAAMVAQSGLPERSFKRRFARATGMSPIEYVHALRLEETKHLLERTELSVEAVANEVGYEDASFFSRLFRRRVGLTPAQYRRRFSALRAVLTDSAVG